jgi:ATP-dependent RNA helicase DDX10/DBP4
MVKSLEERNVKVGKIKIKESKTQSIKNQLQSFAFQDPELKYLGQRVSIFFPFLATPSCVPIRPRVW